MTTIGLFAVRPTASYRTLELGGSATAVGLVTASYAALSVFAAVPFGRVIDRMGPRRFLLGGLAVLASGCGISAVAPSIPTLAASQALVGLGQTSSILALQAITANRSDLDRAFGRFAVAAGLGQTVGPMMAGLLLGLSLAGALQGRGTTLVFAAAGLLVLFGLAVALWFVGGDPARPESDKAGRPSSLVSTVVGRSGMPQALATSIVTSIAVDLLIAYLPVLGEARRILPTTIGILLALRAASSIASRMAMAAMLRLLHRQQLLLWAMAISGLGMLGIALASTALIMFPLITAVGFGLGLGPPMTMTWVALAAPEDGRGTAMAVRVTGNRIGQVILPLVVGGLASVLGPGTVFVFAGGMLLGGTALVRGGQLDQVT
jgi:MFS family permease